MEPETADGGKLRKRGSKSAGAQLGSEEERYDGRYCFIIVSCLYRWELCRRPQCGGRHRLTHTTGTGTD